MSMSGPAVRSFTGAFVLVDGRILSMISLSSSTSLNAGSSISLF
jgi:hypothetical protein